MYGEYKICLTNEELQVRRTRAYNASRACVALSKERSDEANSRLFFFLSHVRFITKFRHSAFFMYYLKKQSIFSNAAYITSLVPYYSYTNSIFNLFLTFITIRGTLHLSHF